MEKDMVDYDTAIDKVEEMRWVPSRNIPPNVWRGKLDWCPTTILRFYDFYDSRARLVSLVPMLLPLSLP